MLQSVMPDNAFCGKGKVGPSVFMTDNCSELCDALNNVWPASRLLLCVFHLMQQVWRWLFDRKHGISAADRPGMLFTEKRIGGTTKTNMYSNICAM